MMQLGAHAALRGVVVWAITASALAAPAAREASVANAAAGGRAPQLLWSHEGQLQAVPASATNHRTPLGSTWKLFPYSYLVATDAHEPPYRCEAAQRRSDEEYCCDPGESVDRDTALARSCGPYFAPQRLQLSATEWRGFWQQQAEARGTSAPDWLLTLPALQPATVVPAASLISALQQVPDSARQAARGALLTYTLRDSKLLSQIGSGPRFKTWSWTDATGQRIGGAAGWLADGSPFWFGASGTSRTALNAQASWLATQWQPQQALVSQLDAANLQAQPCIDVRFFTRYPLARVQRDDGRAVLDGPLKPGAYTLQFSNSQSLAIRGQPVLRLRTVEGVPQLEARLPLEDYVARVVDREGDGRETEAARALAIAARSWVLQNTSEQGGCRAVDDDSRAQRVSPNPPSAAAQAAASFTQGLVLNGAPVRYHSEQSSTNVMAWSQAVSAGRAGQNFEAILRHAYPQAALAGLQGLGDCAPLPQATAWLSQRQARWREKLRSEAGYETPGPELQVCQLMQGVPFSDQRRLRIHLRDWQTREGRVTLIHEYLHLAFRNHPKGHDEAFVERLAQSLADS